MSDSQRLLPTAVRLLRPFAWTVILSTVAGIASGIATASLLATINRSLYTSDGITNSTILAFVVLFVITIAGEIISDMGSSTVGQRVIASLRNELTAKILRAPIVEIEQYRPHRIITALNNDIGTISNFTFGFSSFAIALAVTLGCFAYMVWLSPMLFGITLAAIVLGALATIWARNKGIRGFAVTRNLEDQLQSQYRAIIEGAKELRMHRPRRIDIFKNKIQATTRKAADTFIEGMLIFCTANAFSSALYFFAIGILLIVHDKAGNVQESAISGFVLVLLYVRGPLGQVVGQFPMFARAQIAMKHLAELTARFETPEAGIKLDADDVQPAAIRTVELRDVRFAFPTEAGKESFSLGPIDLRIDIGDILFVTGENGSGKTTLIKLLLGLYTPTAGQILINGEPLTAASLDDYRQSFATVFSDYYLFDELNLPPSVDVAEVSRYLARMEIAHKVKIEDGRFNTTDLSTGQRKRLALIHAYVEGRPILVFDEWAADQDPEFRRFFYNEILPELQRQGRTIIAISHDDRYFHVADKRLVMRNGGIAESVQEKRADDTMRENAAA
ncbi:cyclic peptide export ABC transporter [Bordetella sp. LUAb4]|uniref:cyclic peptide export ABC transporter n=1 Tax=Bordetella sp. LUAb4 TaxID=2843195 RepID=UPI001E393C1C|nr:cyclic peptide export ABC transporter [Bordetella sp. LUAb4]